MPRITSTSVITGTGFMKCMPMTLSGRFVAAAIFVIEMDDVFEARMHSRLVILSSFSKSCVFAATFSTIASTTRSASVTESMFVVVVMRPRMDCFSPAVSFPLSTAR